MRKSWRTHLGLACLVFGVILAVPYAAAAGGPPASAVSQYVETIPTSAGSQVVGGNGTSSKSDLSRAAKKALQNANPAVAKQLTQIATSSDYGAPPAAQAAPNEHAGTTPQPQRPSDAPTAAPTAIQPVSALGVVRTDVPPALALMAVLGLVAVGIAMAAIGSHRPPGGRAAAPPPTPRDM